MSQYKNKSLNQQAYSIIKEKILSHQYEPDNHTSENTLVEELGMSRTPIREALYQLQQEGLLKIIPKKGVFIQTLSPKETRDYYDLRLAIESYTLKLLRGYLTDKHFSVMEDMIKSQYAMLNSGNYQGWVTEDQLFHRFFLTLFDNNVFLDVYENVRQRAYFRPAPIYCYEYYKESTLQHQQLIQCLKDKEYDKADEVLYQHIMRGKKNFI